MIGIGVTTFRRPDMAARFHGNLAKYTDDYILVEHDDSETEKGVAASKNYCLAQLMNSEVDHIFLFDDDTWPIEDFWWVPYVESGVHHLSYNWFPNWDHKRECWPIDQEGVSDFLLNGWNTSNGCMLYYTRKAIETAGGMRTQFGKWGFEHLEHSYRIHKFGLTPEPFISLASQRGIYATDEHNEDFKTSSSSITPTERREWYARNQDFYRYWIEQEPRFVPWD